MNESNAVRFAAELERLRRDVVDITYTTMDFSCELRAARWTAVAAAPTVQCTPARGREMPSADGHVGHVVEADSVVREIAATLKENKSVTTVDMHYMHGAL